jgi:uncharacterized membrane protein HdeD (DUF308 family)
LFGVNGAISDRNRSLLIGAAGGTIIAIALAAALLPLAEGLPARRVIGWMLLAAGLLELGAGMLRWCHRPAALVAGAATLLAGVRLLVENVNFFELLNLVILWLVVRAAALGYAAFRSRQAVGPWLALSAGTDLLLGIALLAGLPIAYLVVGLFGPTRPIVATFAWVVGLSFVANGAFLLATARLETPPDAGTTGRAH